MNCQITPEPHAQLFKGAPHPPWQKPLTAQPPPPPLPLLEPPPKGPKGAHSPLLVVEEGSWCPDPRNPPSMSAWFARMRGFSFLSFHAPLTVGGKDLHTCTLACLSVAPGVGDTDSHAFGAAPLSWGYRLPFFMLFVAVLQARAQRVLCAKKSATCARV